MTGQAQQEEQPRILVTGANGQLGRELARRTPPGINILLRDHQQLDIADRAAVEQELLSCEPDAVINAAAYTAVDRAEDEVELANSINGEGPGFLAQACASVGARFVHVSTDFVFDGLSSRPYKPEHPVAPVSAYGASKLLGEKLSRQAYPSTLILRTSWVYSAFGHNFVKTMLRLMAERDQLSVVEDQLGTPTWANGLAQACWALATAADAAGTYHYSDAGACSWYDFACAIAEEGLALGLINKLPEIKPIPTAEYPTPAKRPAFSVLDKSRCWRELGLPAHHWRVQLRNMLTEFKEQPNG